MTSAYEDFMGSFVAHFDHGLLMIEDSQSTAAHDAWDAAGEYVHFDQDSLYIAVQSLVDGPVAVAVYRNEAPRGEVDGMVEAFSGEFELSLGRLKIHDSDDRIVLTVLGKRGLNRVKVFLDELNWAARVVLIMNAAA